MSNFFGGHLSIFQFFEDKLSYYYLGVIFWGTCVTTAIISILGILEQAMSAWIEKFILVAIIVPFVKVGAMSILDVGEGVNLEL